MKFLLEELNMDKKDIFFNFLEIDFGITSPKSALNNSGNMFKIRPIKCYKLLTQPLGPQKQEVMCNSIFGRKRSSNILQGRKANAIWNLKTFKSHKQFEYKRMFSFNS